MKIGFDISQTGDAKAGCGYFADSLIRGLAEQDRENEYLLYPTFGDVYWDADLARGTYQTNRTRFRRMLLRKSFDDAQQFWRNPPADFEERLGSPDIVHANNFFCPTGLRTARLLYTLYDLAFIEHPDLTTETNRVSCFTGVFNAALYADHVMAISEYSRKHFLQTFPHYPAERVSVVYPSSRFGARAALAQPSKLARLAPGQFWLSVGTIEPRKNHQRLIEAYARHKASTDRSLPLVLAGGSGWLMDSFEQLLRDMGVRDDVILTGYLDDTEIQWLYQNCFAFVYPSLFEGFGLPVLEAMSLGAATISSNVTSLPEIVGSAGILVDPLQSDGIFDAMRMLAADEGLRVSLQEAAMHRAKTFSVERMVQQARDLYRKILSSPRLEQGLPEGLQGVYSNWTKLGKDDPLWAVLTWPEKKGGNWSPDEFFDVGRRDIKNLLLYLQSQGVQPKRGKALDFGCGAGRLTQALAEHFSEVHGVDIAPSMIETANRLNKYPDRCFFHVNKADNLAQFEDATFDFVITFITLQHIPQAYAVKYIAELARIVRPEGILLFQVPDSLRGANGAPSGEAPRAPRGVGREPMMIMSGVPYGEVVRVLTEQGMRLVDVAEDRSAGPQWLSYRYCAVKEKNPVLTEALESR